MEIGALNELLATLQPAAPAPSPTANPAVAAADPAPASEPAPAAAPIQSPQAPVAAVPAVPLAPQASISAPEPVIPEPAAPALHPMAQRISEMLASGESHEAVRRFVEVQTVDTTRLSDMDAVRFNFQNKYPFLAPAEVDAKIIQEIGIDPTGVDAPDARQSAALKIAANQARAEINSQKVNVSPQAAAAPVSQVPAQTTPVVNPAVEQGWMKVLEAATPTFANLPIKAEVPEIGAYAHDFQFSTEAVAFARAEVQKLAVQNNMPFDQASLGRLQGIAQKLMIAHDFQSIVASVAKDAYESGRTSVAARVAGSPTVAAPTTAPVAGAAAPKPARLPLVG